MKKIDRLRKIPFSMGKDVRGDTAIFIPNTAKMNDPKLIAMLKKQEIFDDQVFFRLIDAKGNQLHSHGWVRYNPKTGEAEVTQWG